MTRRHLLTLIRANMLNIATHLEKLGVEGLSLPANFVPAFVMCAEQRQQCLDRAAEIRGTYASPDWVEYQLMQWQGTAPAEQVAAYV